MNETLALVLAGVAGGAAGRDSSSAAFGGRFAEALSSGQPALWFFGSLLLRTGVTLAGFYLVSGGHWERLLAVPPGILRRERRRDVAGRGRQEKPVGPAREAADAPHS